MNFNQFWIIHSGLIAGEYKTFIKFFISNWVHPKQSQEGTQVYQFECKNHVPMFVFLVLNNIQEYKYS